MNTIASLIKDVIHLLYPHHCKGCGTDILSYDQQLCIYCLEELPKTHFAYIQHNTTEKIFTGRINIKSAHSEWYFTKGKLIQHLIHELKYNGDQQIGKYLGSLLGSTLLESKRFTGADLIIPMPMHKKKQFKRGYNQASIIAEGVAEIMKLPVKDDLIERTRGRETQTKKHRAERWENVKNAFGVKNKNLLKGKQILLVDDVITTGASLEACTETILKAEASSVSIATLAIATD